ncbi:transcriptional regulator, LysR family [Methylobacterium sp. 4-46]|uniref:LysR family transcriptional regulator n=1 Tax=unclassified Methylobacterium TaxID=2615210 RepID=UPI000152D77F|nr:MULTISPECIES: LysR family transcriptional regulator [Methylobacterium]ACA16926.1 transcriptional regulator, LysR family [Methylobacterium sp. 4-46]WFT82613.1 LysR family transcriptional regulator [Methylobacterium nodulans]
MREPEGGQWDDYRFALAVFRAGTVSAAARLLGVDHATVIRRIDRLERQLGERLFHRRASGYVATQAGQAVAATADAVESAIINGQSLVGRSAARLTGTVRIGAPDGFGSTFLAPRLTGLVERHPDLDIQLVATARLFSLSKREADIAIGLSLPREGRIVGRKLTDYALKLYAAPSYLRAAPPIESRRDLERHRFVGYIEELLYTPELDYLRQVSSGIGARLRSANVIAQLHAVAAGIGLAVLPCFMAAGRPDLVCVLPREVVLTRSFWLLMHADSRDLARVRAVAEHIYAVVERDRDVFFGGADGAA